MTNPEVVAILNQLSEMCREGQDGFRIAAKNVGNSEFRRLFNILSQQRAQFVTELQSEIHRLGGTPQPEHGASGRRSGWVNLDAAVRDEDQTALLTACQWGEDAAVDCYRKALENDLPPDVQYAVKRQYMDIKDAYDRISILRRAA